MAAVITSIISYYVAVSRFVDAGSMPAGLVALAYIFVPLIGLPLVVSFWIESLNAKLNRYVSSVVSAVGTTVASIFVVLVLNGAFKPTAPDPVAREAARQADWVARGKASVKARLKDAASAEFRAVRFYRGADGVPVTCGEVNSKNGFGGYVGFQRFISAGSAESTYLQEQMGAQDFARVWNRLCVG